MRIALAGGGRLALGLMQALLDSDHEIVALIQNARTSRGVAGWLSRTFSAAMANNVIGLAVRNRIPIVWIDRMDDRELAPLRAIGPDLILVGGFGIILKRPILDLPKIGCLNVHSSLLPKHRGPNPFSAVLLHGETESGVTFHIVDEGIDTGDIVEQYSYPLKPDDNAMAVHNRACDLASERVAGVIDRVAREGLHGVPQNTALATYDQKIRPEDRFIDWNDSARNIERRLRALKPFAMLRFRYRGHAIVVTMIKYDETPVDAEPGTVLVSGRDVKVATGLGTVTIVIAYGAAPIPWLWPAPWCLPKPGEKLE